MIQTTLQPDVQRSRAFVLIAALVLALVSALAAQGAVGAATPTCSDVLDIEVHGQHIVGDYVTGAGHDMLDWPPAGKVGQEIAGSGPAVRGGPGPGFHFPNGFAPGASFCKPHSQSPGFHVP